MRELPNNSLSGLKRIQLNNVLSLVEIVYTPNADYAEAKECVEILDGKDSLLFLHSEDAFNYFLHYLGLDLIRAKDLYPQVLGPDGGISFYKRLDKSPQQLVEVKYTQDTLTIDHVGKDQKWFDHSKHALAKFMYAASFDTINKTLILDLEVNEC